MKKILNLLIISALTPLAALAQKAETPRQALIVVSSHSKLGDTGKPTGWYLSEVTHVYYPLIKAGYKIDFASTEGGAAPLDPSSRDLKDADNKKFLEDKKLQEQIKNTLPLAKVDSKKYQIIHFAGGHGAMWDFPGHKEVNRVTAEIYENNGIISSVCHGVAALVDVKLKNGDYLVKGKDINSFTNAEEEAVGLTKVVPFLLESKLKERGANFIAGDKWADKVVISGRVITGQNPQSAHTLGARLVELAAKK